MSSNQHCPIKPYNSILAYHRMTRLQCDCHGPDFSAIKIILQIRHSQYNSRIGSGKYVIIDVMFYHVAQARDDFDEVLSFGVSL